MAKNFYTDTEIAELVTRLRMQADVDVDDIEVNDVGETDDYEMSFEGVQDSLREAADIIEYLTKTKTAE